MKRQMKLRNFKKQKARHRFLEPGEFGDGYAVSESRTPYLGTGCKSPERTSMADRYWHRRTICSAA